MKDHNFDYTLLFMMVIAIGVVVFVITYEPPKKERKIVKIVSVGGCSSSARCGVKFSDGSFGEVYLPVVDKEVEVEK